MNPLTAAEMEEAKIVIPWKVWNWLDKAGEDIFTGYIGYERADGVMFPRVPAYLRDEFNRYCAERLQAQKASNGNS